jgi:hypothetical protein
MEPIRTSEPGEGTALFWLARGMRKVLSLPAFILMSAFVGFAGFARESGIELAHAVFMTAAIWALPAQVVLIAAIKAGNDARADIHRRHALVCSIDADADRAGTAIAGGKNTRTVTLLFLSHFVAVTSWVMANQYIDTVPRRFRTAYFGGFAVTLTSLNIAMVVGSVLRFPPPFRRLCSVRCSS